MGVDYSAGFGIGYKIKKASSEVLEDYWEDIGVYINSILENFVDGISYITFGNSYGGEVNYALVVDEPFADGLDLTHIKACLDDVIDSSPLERDSEFGLVGGLGIW